MIPHARSHLEHSEVPIGGTLRPVDDGRPLEDGVRPAPPLRRILMLTDFSVVVLGWVAAILVMASDGTITLRTVTVASNGVATVAAAGLLLSASGLYRRRICAVRREEVTRIGWVSVGLAALTLLWFVGTAPNAAAFASVVGAVAWFTLLVVERGLFREWIHGRRATGDYGAPVLLVAGSDAAAHQLASFLSEHPVLGFEVKGIAVAHPKDPSGTGRSVGLLDLARRVTAAGAAGAFVDAGSLTGDELDRVVRQLTDANLHVHVDSGFLGVDSRRVSLAPLADQTLLHIAPVGLSRGQAVAKRAVDVTIGAGMLLVATPLLFVCALVVWGYDRGPVFFRQERVGQDGERFMIYKLRTMVTDAEERRAELERENGRSGPLFKLVKDPRVTPFGRFLRASSIDELPQLFNVLEGTMSLVGPRPALASEVEQFDDALRARMNVKPGMTGLWQVEARDLPSFELYRRYDLLYVRNWSLVSDLNIVVRTTAVVFLRSGRALLPTRWRRQPVAALE